MITNNVKKRIADLIELEDSFIYTCFDDASDNEGYNTYEAIELFDTIIIRSEFTDGCTDDTEYFIYNSVTDTLRRLVDGEDEYLREADLNDYPIREKKDLQFIICKTKDGVKRFDEELRKLDDSTESLLETEFRRENFDLWIEFCRQRGYKSH